ncbi:MAG: LysE family transporter [Bacteroidales bacterium]|nr:LysE family transporter [Bacteroidales bacterium]
MTALYNGLLLGLLLSIFIGATFFVLIETSIHRGFKSALTMNLGVFISDIMLILLTYFSTSEFLDSLISNNYFKLAGGFAFFGFGLYYIFKKHQRNIAINENINYAKLFLNGIVINILNPSVVAFWLGSVIFIVAHKNYSIRQALIFYSSCLSVIVLTDLIKIYFASKLKRFIGRQMLKVISVMAGILFVLLSLRIFLIT